MAPKTAHSYKTPPLTGKEIFFLYLDSLNHQEVALAKSFFVRFLIPALGGVPPRGNRATVEEIERAFKFSESLTLSQLQKAKIPQEEYFEKLNLMKSKRRLPRCSLNKFISWLEKQGWLLKEDLLRDEGKSHRMNLPKGQRLPVIKLGGKTPAANHMFSKIEGDILSPRLQQQIEGFKSFSESKGIRSATYETDYANMLRFLGWFYHVKEEKQFSMEELCFETLIPVIDTNINPSDFLLNERQEDYKDPSLIEFLSEKYRREKEAKELAEEKIKLFDEYFKFINGHPKTKVNRLQSLINVAKYLYQNITQDNDPKEGYHDIPIIEIFRKKRKCEQRIARITDPTVPHEVKNVPWDKVFDVLNKLRIEVDNKYNYSQIKGKTTVINRKKRNFYGLVRSYQRFLLLAFMCLMPPDRSRTYQELEIGKTLVWGDYDGSHFTPKEKMSFPDQAKLYLRLNRLDYKTGNTYGKYWCEVPNREFPNGKKFYNYINEWLEEYRPLLGKNHNKFFTKHQDNDQSPWDVTSVRLRIRYIFMRLAQTPVSPKELRTMYITNLKKISASYSELESAAVAMHHSVRTQSIFYDRLDQHEKLKPIASLNEKIWIDYWRSQN